MGDEYDDGLVHGHMWATEKGSERPAPPARKVGDRESGPGYQPPSPGERGASSSQSRA
jgi:hypothetical protein